MLFSTTSHLTKCVHSQHQLGLLIFVLLRAVCLLICGISRAVSCGISVALIQYYAVLCGIIRYNAMLCDVMRCNVIRCYTILSDIVRYLHENLFASQKKAKFHCRNKASICDLVSTFHEI